MSDFHRPARGTARTWVERERQCPAPV